MGQQYNHWEFMDLDELGRANVMVENFAKKFEESSVDRYDQKW